MGMKVTESSERRVLSMLGRFRMDLDEAVTGAFSDIGSYVTDRIRSGEMSSWSDSSGALRSSVGYAVCRKGRIVSRSGFQTVGGGSEGSASGQELISTLASRYSGYPFALLIVAGMEYAVYVEALDNRVVLAEGQLYVEKNITRALQGRIDEVLRKYK